MGKQFGSLVHWFTGSLMNECTNELENVVPVRLIPLVFSLSPSHLC